MTFYRFIRTGYQPTRDTCTEDVLLGCFEPCSDEVKEMLQRFLNNKRRIDVKFEFENQTVWVERILQ